MRYVIVVMIKKGLVKRSPGSTRRASNRVTVEVTGQLKRPVGGLPR
jgi:hypothetical protein